MTDEIKWANKNITSLSDGELISASQTLDQMLVNYNKKMDSPKAVKKFKGQNPPEINPKFSQIDKAIKDELIRRKIKI